MANDLSVEFADTYWGFKQNEEYRPDLPELLDFFLHIGVIDSRRRQELAGAGEKKGKAFLERAFSLRTALLSILTALAAGKEPPQEGMATLDDALRRNRSCLELHWSGGAFHQVWKNDNDPYGSLLHPVLEAAQKLLLGDEWMKLKRCVECGYFFLDTSRNGLRRYCSMQRGCGSWAKARRHASKAKKAGKTKHPS
jgi:predicted RNA-binding Zn ribbon-like protein